MDGVFVGGPKDGKRIPGECCVQPRWSIAGTDVKALDAWDAVPSPELFLCRREDDGRVIELKYRFMGIKQGCYVYTFVSEKVRDAKEG